MVRKFEIEKLHCLCSPSDCADKIAYIIYPMDILTDWIETAAERYGTTIVVITGIEWQDALSPWPTKGVPKGCQDFKGEAHGFLGLLKDKVLPLIESEMGFENTPQRTLFGVSMSGLFALWQWMECDTFTNIASLSGSFWYEGFLDWMKHRQIPQKTGMAYFLLGDQEAKSRVKAFRPVAENTREIITILEIHGISAKFQSVAGNHYSDPVERLDRAFKAIYCDNQQAGITP